MGYSVIRGSTYKQAVASARALIRVLKKDQRIIVIADGSRGPRCVAQPGSLHLAAITGASGGPHDLWGPALQAAEQLGPVCDSIAVHPLPPQFWPPDH